MARSRKTTVPPGGGRAVQIGELKARLSEYVREAEGGATVVVTAYGRPVADLVPHPQGPPLRVRPATRPWGSVELKRTGKGKSDSVALLVAERRKR